MAEIAPGDYSALLIAVKDRIRAGQQGALRAVNIALINLYWDIGKLIVERQQGQTWGRAVVQTLAQDLQAEFVGVSGFSASNLWRMKLFYETYTEKTKLAPLVREISWSHNIVIMERCRDDLEREFYLRMARRMGWSRNVLTHQIENQTYAKTLLNQANFAQTLPAPLSDQAQLIAKDEYTFDFLELGDEHSERQLEQALVVNIAAFLRELGGLFAFVGSQYRLEVSEKEYFVDVLLYHRRLQCLIAIELKIGEFVPEYVGKMQFYLAALDELVRLPGENPSIGIILCKAKDKLVVEYALRESNKPISVATYRIVSTLPRELQDQLPAPEQIARLLQDV
jgi:predicted nuclease of restriction endonuclease-like (RecB) superfamily